MTADGLVETNYDEGKLGPKKDALHLHGMHVMAALACARAGCPPRGPALRRTHGRPLPRLRLAVIESFDDMGLKEDLLRGIYSYGFEVRAAPPSLSLTAGTRARRAQPSHGRQDADAGCASLVRSSVRRSPRPSSSVPSSR